MKQTDDMSMKRNLPNKKIFIFDLLDNSGGHYSLLQKHVDKMISPFNLTKVFLFGYKRNKIKLENIKFIPKFIPKKIIEGNFLKKFRRKFLNFLIVLYNVMATATKIITQKPSIILFLSCEELFLPLLVTISKRYGKVGIFVHYLSSSKSLLAKLRRKKMISSIKKCDIIVVRENYIKDYLNVEIGIPKNKIIILPHIPGFIINKTTKETNSDDKKKRITISFVGQIREDKGIFFLIEALKSLHIKKKTLESIFKISGEPTSQNIYKKILRLSSEIPNLTLNLNPLNEEKYLMELLSADIIVLPYKKDFGEGRLSGPLFDAIFCGKPILAPDFGIFRHYVEKYKIGWLFKAENSLSLADLLIKLNGNHEEILQIKKNAINLKNELSTKWKYENFSHQFKKLLS